MFSMASFNGDCSDERWLHTVLNYSVAAGSVDAGDFHSIFRGFLL